MSYKTFVLKFWFLTSMLPALLSGCQSYPFEEVPSSSFSEKRWTKTITLSSAVDILFVIDNSLSMAGEQRQLADSFQAFTSSIEDFFGQDYRIAIITTGVLSDSCILCSQTPILTCINETGESGKFQDRVGKNVGTVEDPDYEFEPSNPACRVASYNNKSCFYDETNDDGTVFVGIMGCGYERGLAPLRPALETYINDYNENFLRENATLAVVVISDEEDCGEPGDITEGLEDYYANMCYYASKGIDPDGNTEDPQGKPYRLTPIQEYYDFLVGLKGNQKSLVKFAAIVGVSDVNDPLSTQIEYEPSGSGWNLLTNACVTSGCQDNQCDAKPGTRYIQLANMFGLEPGGNGFVDTICQSDFSDTMEALGGFIGCPKVFTLSEPILDPALANILINNVAVPRYSCNVPGQVQKCTGPDDASCECVETWTYTVLDSTISFAAHYNPCELFETGETIRIELIYVVE